MTTLTFETIGLRCGTMGQESIVPDIWGQGNVQNQTKFELDEYDEIYEAYGQRATGYPYRQQNIYSRELKVRQTDAAVLENEKMRAVFLPGYGGRLWQLYDKVNKRDVLYTNDCLRASNLAIRNAWFSGGAEWNCGVIGHNPFTMDKVFASRIEKDGVPVLRMYTYERIRSVVYQIDFWLDEEKPALNCHMSVHNPGTEVVPMYWWTNIASPFYPQGRLLVPAHKAYSYDNGKIVKVDIPYPREGQNVSKYQGEPVSKDYFFVLDEKAPRWIANVDADGYGLLHTSTQRLQSRKLFVWGQTGGSSHWQEFLTDSAGPYIELQAGIGKTQYGCIPMAPHTTWEWTERFEPVQLTPHQQTLSFDEAGKSVSEQIIQEDAIRPADRFGHQIMKEKSELIYEGTGDAALQDALRAKSGKEPMRGYLNFESSDPRQEIWKKFLKTGVLQAPSSDHFPAYDPMGGEWLCLLKESLHRRGGKNWYSYYCISLLEREAGRMDLAKKAIDKSIEMQPTACGYYVKAVYQLEKGKQSKAARTIMKGLMLENRDLSYLKAALQILIDCGAWEQLLSEYEELNEKNKADPRIRLFYARALCETGHDEKALSILEENGGLQLDDVREGEIAAGQLWCELKLKMTGSCPEVPHVFDFNALGVNWAKEQ